MALILDFPIAITSLIYIHVNLHTLFGIVKILLSTIFYVKTFLKKMKTKKRKTKKKNFNFFIFCHMVKRQISRFLPCQKYVSGYPPTLLFWEIVEAFSAQLISKTVKNCMKKH